MNKRIIIIILVALAFAALVGFLWLWLLGGSVPQPKQPGSFGTGQNRAAGSGSQTSTPTNIATQVSQTGASTGNNTSYQTITVPQGSAGASSTASGSAPGVSWLSGGSISAGSGVTFTPAAINQLNNGQIGGSVSVLGTFSNPDTGGNSSSIGASLGVLGATAVSCLLFLAPGPGSAPSIPPAVPVQNSSSNNKSFLDCIARTMARAAIQQITSSVVNWINSGFNGQPSFVTNYQLFFARVADSAAGSFIQNYTNFAPFCTPFSKQIQQALAQSYARRNSAASSCTLSQLIGTDITPFLTGNFSQGGWSGLLAYTTNPANNPFTAYAQSQAQLYATQIQAAQNANKNVSPGGFLNTLDPYDCQPTVSKTQAVPGQCPEGCKCRILTPGSVIQDSLSNTLKVSLDSLNLAKSFDEIISALIQQLMTRALQGGVANLSGQNGYASYYLTPDQQAAQDKGQALLTSLQSLVVIAQQYGQAAQGSIQDIQAAQAQLANLANCWQGAASSTSSTITDAARGIAANNMLSALALVHTYDAQIVSLNAQITRANNAIAILQDLQTKTLNVGSTADVSAIQGSLDQAQAQGLLIAPPDVTQAQQDRTTLQTQLGSQNASNQTQLQQCYDFVK